MDTVTTINGEVWKRDSDRALAHLIYIRFGRDLNAAAAAWRRLLNNNTTSQEFKRLID